MRGVNALAVRSRAWRPVDPRLRAQSISRAHAAVGSSCDVSPRRHARDVLDLLRSRGPEVDSVRQGDRVDLQTLGEEHRHRKVTEKVAESVTSSVAAWR